MNVRKRKTAGTWVKWTPDEDRTLRRLVAAGNTAAAIAKVLTRRTIGAIHNRRTVLGIHCPRKFPLRDPRYMAAVVKFKMAGWTHAAIAEVHDCSPSEISAILCRNGLHRFRWVRRKHKKPRDWWSEVEEALLRKYLQRGVPLKWICLEFPHRSAASVRGKAARIMQYWLPRETQAKWEHHHRRWVNRTEFYVKGEVHESRQMLGSPRGGPKKRKGRLGPSLANPVH